MAAVRSGNDNDARKFLTYKSRLETEKMELNSQYNRAKDNSEKMRQMLKKLSDDINTSEDKLKELKQKLTVAKQQEKLNKLDEKFSNNNPLSGAGSLLDAVQKRVDAADAAASLDRELFNESKDIEDLAKKYDTVTQKVVVDQVEDQLAMLKIRLGR
jgi:phage shock protein A